MVQMAITLLPTSAQERRLNQIQPLLLDLTEKQRFTFFAFAFAAHD